jgi:PAS domain S-box-containing protein
MISESPVATATLEAMLGALPVPAFTTDLGGVVTWQNSAARAVLGDLCGAHFSKAVPPEELQRAREGFAAVTLSGATTRRAGFFRATNGELVKQEVIAAPIRVDGNVVGVFGIAIPSSDLPRPAATDHLSPRQLDVLRLLAQAKSTDQIRCGPAPGPGNGPQSRA